MSKRKQTEWKTATKLVRGGMMRSQFGETSEALFLTSGYAYDSAEQAAARMSGDEEGYVYSRYGNPTNQMLADRLALLEGAETCRVTSSGMGAISSVLIAPCSAGDRVVAATALFGSCRHICSTILPRFGVETEFVQGGDLQAWQRALSKKEMPGSKPVACECDFSFANRRRRIRRCNDFSRAFGAAIERCLPDFLRI